MLLKTLCNIHLPKSKNNLIKRIIPFILLKNPKRALIFVNVLFKKTSFGNRLIGNFNKDEVKF